MRHRARRRARLSLLRRPDRHGNTRKVLAAPLALHPAPGGSSAVGYFCFFQRDCAHAWHSSGWALAVRGGTPSVPPWILPAHALNTAFAYASRVVLLVGGQDVLARPQPDR
eukprot:153953-Prymnesium_polylepis.1